MSKFADDYQPYDEMTTNKIVHLHLHEPFKGKSDYYFGSLKAIYSILPEEVVGIKYTSLTAKRFARYENKKCVINVDEIKRNPKK